MTKISVVIHHSHCDFQLNISESQGNENVNAFKLYLQSQCSPYQNISDGFTEFENKILNFTGKTPQTTFGENYCCCHNI